ncbi:MAG: YgiQ family radical SAM protein [Bacteroidales bacterium]|nr:YgiQ family radical SAM protein [Bacteroidales bacterium]
MPNEIATFDGNMAEDFSAWNRWLPTSRKELEREEIEEADVILFTGDAYVDHPSFGAAVIGRVMEDEGAVVAVVPQPNWKDDLRDFRKLGKPRMFFAVTAGNMDSMVNHYTAARRLRSDDAYTPGGKAGFRPDYPTVVYTRILKELFPDVPVLIGGIEASMRRFSHYDYWKDSVEPSMLIWSGADMLVYGMGEEPVREIIRLLSKGVPFSSLRTIPQTGIVGERNSELPVTRKWSDLWLDSHEKVSSDKKAFGSSFVLFEKETNKIDQARILQECGEKLVIVNPPYPPASQSVADSVYDLPFNYLPHPRYKSKGAIPAYEMIKNSVNIHRGCFGGCSFCAIAAHQGKHVVSRTKESVLKEIDKISSMEGFKGVVSDLGGPSANMYGMKPIDGSKCLKCSRPSCIYPSVCRNLDTSHKELNDLYEASLKREGIKKVYIGSGVRYDLLLKEHNKNAGKEEDRYFNNLIARHISGWFKVAPEHTDDDVLKLMRKPSFELFRIVKRKYDALMKRSGTKGMIIPYLISAHPGCTVPKMELLAGDLRELDIRPEQVQEFTPTPMTLSTTIYYTGMNPYSGERVYVPRDAEEKRRQKNYFFWYRNEEAGGRRTDKRNNVAREQKKTGGRSRRK